MIKNIFTKLFLVSLIITQIFTFGLVARGGGGHGGGGHMGGGHGGRHFDGGRRFDGGFGIVDVGIPYYGGFYDDYDYDYIDYDEDYYE